MKLLEYFFPCYQKKEEILIDFESIDTYSSYANSSFSEEEDEFYCCFFKCLNR